MKNLSTPLLLATTVLAFGCMPETTPPETITEIPVEETPTDTAPVRGKTVLISDADSGDTGELRFKLDTADALASGKFSVDVWLAEGETQTVKISVMGSGSSTSDVLGRIRLDEGYAIAGDGYAGIRLEGDPAYGDTGTTVADIETETWVNLALEWDTGTSTYNVLIDDVPQAGYSMTHDIASARYFTVTIAGNADNADLAAPLYIDNFAVYSDTSGTTVVLEDNFDSYGVGDIEVESTNFDSSTFSASVSDVHEE